MCDRLDPCVELKTCEETKNRTAKGSSTVSFVVQPGLKYIV